MAGPSQHVQNFRESLAFALATVTMTPYAKVALIKKINIVDCSLYISNIIAVLRIFVGHILAEIIRKLKIPKNWLLNYSNYLKFKISLNLQYLNHALLKFNKHIPLSGRKSTFPAAKPYRAVYANMVVIGGWP